ncbi:MAG: ROK family protein [Halobacteriales archaeon]
MTHYVGVDLGATNLQAVLATETGQILADHRRKTPSGPDGATITAAVEAAIEAVAQSANVEVTDIAAAGIGSIGPLDLDMGAVVNPSNFPATVERIALRDPIAALLETEHVVLCNDTVAGAIGERFYGTTTPDNLVYLTISTGIGAGVVVDGHVLSGEDGNVGEVGHTIIDPIDGRACGCGQHGHWEAYCSGQSIPQYARDLFERWDGETSLTLDNDTFGATDVLEAVGTDAFADHVADRLAHWNTIGVVNIVHAYAPSEIRVSGAVALNHPETIIDPVRDRLEDTVITNVPTIEPATLGSDAVVRGALASAITRMDRDTDPEMEIEAGSDPGRR